MFTVAAILAVTADAGYAQEHPWLEDTVVVSNNGAILGGSVETFPPGSHDNAKPSLEVKGNKTLLGAGGVQGDALSSFDGHIVVTSSAANLVMSFGPGSNGNTEPDTTLIGSGDGSSPTGIIIPQGASFQNPVVSGEDIFANSNFGNIVVADFNNLNGCPNKGFTIGSITEFRRTDTLFHEPLNNSPVFELPFSEVPPVVEVNATIAGCDTVLFGPIGLAFESNNDLWVADNLLPGLTKYPAGAFGDAPPIDIVGLFAPTKGDLVDPQYVAVNGEGTELYVSEPSLNRIRIFDVHIPFDATLISTISGKGSKLNRPMGIAFGGSNLDDLYVVNNGDNSLLEFDDPPFVTPAAVIRQDNRNKRVGRTHLNLPVGVALKQF